MSTRPENRSNPSALARYEVDLLKFGPGSSSSLPGEMGEW